MWIETKDRLPSVRNKYLVIIENKGIEEKSFCTYYSKNKRFHFDMPNIDWRVTKWFDDDDRNSLKRYTEWMSRKGHLTDGVIPYESADAYLESNTKK